MIPVSSRCGAYANDWSIRKMQREAPERGASGKPAWILRCLAGIVQRLALVVLP